jgi:hypothetical protein
MKKIMTAGIAVALVAIFLTGAALFVIPEKVSPKAYREAFTALEAYHAAHPEENPKYLAVVDYSKPSFLKRMALIDLTTGEQNFYRVAHGTNSGKLYARRFSNVPQSGMSSLGLYKVLSIYNGDHGRAFRLLGLDSLRNSNAVMRDIVLHSAGYVSLPYIMMNVVTFNGPRIGRSNGCFVVSASDSVEVYARMGQGGFLFAYAESPTMN